MVTLRCTRALLASIPLPLTEVPVLPSGQLGDWYATRVRYRGPPLIVCTSERTLLTILISGIQLETLPERFRAGVLEVLSLIGLPEQDIAAEGRALSDIAIGRATNRRILASLNDFALRTREAFERSPRRPLLEFQAYLLDLPLKPLGFRNMAEATLAAMSAV
jgi:hypothetical protein